jgi:hypothetical protein
MKPADVVTLSIKQGDGQRKLRPALLIKEVSPLSTQLHVAVAL